MSRDNSTSTDKRRRRRRRHNRAAAAATEMKPPASTAKRDAAVDVPRDGVYTFAEVAEHCSDDDAWIVVRGQVVDVTKFAYHHPGTTQALLKRAGHDATAAFDRIGHPARAERLVAANAVGRIVDNEAAAAAEDKLKYAAECDVAAAAAAVPPLPTRIKNFVWRRVVMNKLVWAWVSSALIILILWLLGGRGTPGYGRFAIRHFSGELADPKRTEYAYALAADAPLGIVLSWFGFVFHTAMVLGIVQQAQASRPGYTATFRWFNWALLGVNAGALVLKVVQSQLTYNGLSAQLPLWFGTATVASFLILVHVVRLVDRGIVFGFGQRYIISRHVLAAEMSEFARKYHAYVIAAMIINDFWFHPFESTPGHLLGELNDLLLLWQMALIYTVDHRNAWWTLALELIVLPHSAIIALNRDAFKRDMNLATPSSGVSGMFGFGYLLILVVTQMWQGHLIKRRWLRWATRAFVAITFVVSVGLCYGLLYGFARIWQVVSIPAITYGLFLYFLLTFSLLSRIVTACTPRNSCVRSAAAAVVTVIVVGGSFVPYYFILGG